MPNPKQSAEARPCADGQDAGQRAALDPRAQRGQQEQHQELAAAQQALEAERTRYREMFELAPDAYLKTDSQGVVLEANQAASSLLGVPREALLGRSIWHHAPPSDRPGLEQHLTALESAEPGVPRRWETRLMTSQGGAEGSNSEDGLVDAAVSVAALRPLPGEQPDLCWLIRDVSEQKKVEGALQGALAEAEEARQILDALMEYLPEGISIALGQDMRLTRVSSHGQDLLGPHAGRTVTEVLEDWKGYEPDGVTPIAIEDAPLVRAVRHGEVVEGREIWQETGYGGRILLSCNAGPIRNAKGEINGAIVAWRDVTEERQAQDAVRRLAQFPDVNPDPVLRATPAGALLYANEPGRRLLRSLGWAEGNRLPEPLAGLASQAARLGQDAPRPDGVLRAEMDNAEGRTFWMTLVALSGPEGEAHVNIYGRDITERKRAEDILRGSEARLQALFESLPAGISILDTEGRVRYSNPAMVGILDLSVGELEQDSHARHTFLRPDGSAMPAAEFPSMRAFEGQHSVGAVEIGVLKDHGGLLWANVGAVLLPYDDWHVILTAADVTEKIRARQRIEEQAALVDTMLGSIADSIAFYGPDAQILRTNAAADAMFGYVPGKPIRSLAERSAQSRTRDEDGRPFALEELPVIRALGGETVTGVVMAMDLPTGKKGPPTWTSVSAAPVRGAGGNILGAIVTFTDITELRRAREELEKRVEERTAELVAANQALQVEIAARRQSEAELRESELRFRQLAENIEEVFMLSEPEEGRLLYLSPTYEKLLGRTPAEIYPQPDMALEDVHPEDREKVVALWEGKSAVEEFRLVHPSGAIRWLRGRSFTVEGEPGMPRRIAGLMADITAQKEALAALVHAERLSTAGRMAASLAHEINNPLQSAIGCVDLAREDLQAGLDPSHYLVVVSEALARAARVVGQLRAMGRQWRQEEREPGDLKEAIDKVLLLTQKSSELKGVTVIRELDEDLPAVQLMNDGIQQVLLNLVLNALDAMPLGGTLRVSVEGSEQPRGAWVRLADTGAGIPADDVEHIFEPFRSTKAEGLGLGLFICHNIVANHGGRIEVQSQEGEGTEVRVWLPA